MSHSHQELPLGEGKPTAMPVGAAQEQQQAETRVFYVLVIVFMFFALTSLVALKLISEHKRRSILPVVTFVAFFSIDSVYRHWVELETTYGTRPFEIAFFRTLLVAVIGKVVDSRLLMPSGVIDTNVQTNGSNKSDESSTIKKDTVASWCIWYPIIGILWALEECFSSFPETFFALGITYAVLCFRVKGLGSRATLALTSVAMSSVIMAKSGSITWRSAMAGFCRLLKLLALDFAATKHGALSLPLIWGPGVFATVVTFLAFLIMEFFIPQDHPHQGRTDRGLLDFLSAAVLGSFFTLASMLASLEIMNTLSMVSLQASSILVELLVFCVLTPASGLPLGFRVELPLNIVGFIIGSIACLLLLRADPFASTNVASSALFKFLEEEEEQAAKGGGTVKEIDEEEWLLTLSNSRSEGKRLGKAENV